jgi:hypothetical protein
MQLTGTRGDCCSTSNVESFIDCDRILTDGGVTETEILGNLIDGEIFQ